MQAILLALSTVYGITDTLAQQVCSPNVCLEGESLSLILATDSTSEIYLSPGQYTSTTPIKSLSDLNPASSINQTITHDSGTISVSSPLQPIFFSSSNYGGELKDAGGEWKSLYLPDGWYGVSSPGKALWGSVSEPRQLPVSLSTTSRLSVARSTCNPPCASGGVCIVAVNETASCACSPGWTGATCDTCSDGHFGPSCRPCPENCLVCDDGLSGTGACLGASQNPSQMCDCAHGTCTDSGDCTCAAGYITNSRTTSSTQICSACTDGFFKDIQENCLACPLGCSTCELKQETSNTAICTSCVNGLSLSSGESHDCLASVSCAAGQYFDQGTSSCQDCSPACESCTGPAPSDCLACASPRANLAGTCVGYDATNAICDSTLSPLKGVFVVNNGKRKCDACPAGCVGCTIPSFSSAVGYDKVSCQACQDGYLLQDDQCVKQCTDGWFIPNNSADRNGTCQRCDSDCVACSGSGNACTKCASPNSAFFGQCLSTCPASTIAINGTCLACSPDCATCSTPGSASSCLSCPSSRPVLSDGGCLDHCPKNSFFDQSTAACKTCDGSCGSCSDATSSDCTSCPEGSLLRHGTCVVGDCGSGGLAPGLGVCLSALVKIPKRNLKSVIAIPFILGLFALLAWWWIRRERAKTRAKTREFANNLDESQAKDGLMIIRLETLLGLDRIRPQPQPPLWDDGQSRLACDRKRLRDLLLPSKRRERMAKADMGPELPLQDIPLHDRHVVSKRDSTWYNPPPPYFIQAESSRHSATSSVDTIDTLALPLAPSHDVKFTPREKVDHPFANSSLATPTLATRSTVPPPRRPAMSKVPIGRGTEDGRDVVRRDSSRKVWPDMPPPPVSPIFGNLSLSKRDKMRAEHRMI